MMSNHSSAAQVCKDLPVASPILSRKKRVATDEPEGVHATDGVQQHSPETNAKVVRLKRVGGKVVQGCDVYIGRACNMGGWHLPQSKWANPFTVRKEGSAAAAVAKYEHYIMSNSSLLKDLRELRGKTLGCWCYPGPCHGNVLVSLLHKSEHPHTP